ncbi:hypothetical protein BJV74DRAFT_953109 [Russula compacta]|nr:hypothetical protein BJV74DRAFT_953109 [Russula compacta]
MSVSSGKIKGRDSATSNSQSNDNDVAITFGGLDDDDETPEREAALSSPTKEGKRLTSAGIVKIEQMPTPVKQEKPARTSQKGIAGFRLWFNVLESLGGYSNIWTVPDEVLLEMMSESLSAVYLDQDYNIQINCPVFRKLQQHAYDYRSGFGSAGLAVINNFFVSLDVKTKTEEGIAEKWTNDERARLAKHLLTDLRFLYLHADGDDKSKFTGLFRGHFIIETFATHFTAIDSSKMLKGDQEPKSPLALSAVAVERRLKAWADRHITKATVATIVADDSETAKAKKVPFKKMLTKGLGKESTKTYTFGEANWGSQMKKYYKIVNKKLRPESLKSIVSEAKAQVKTSHHSESDNSDESDDDFAGIVDVSDDNVIMVD